MADDNKNNWTLNASWPEDPQTLKPILSAMCEKNFFCFFPSSASKKHTFCLHSSNFKFLKLVQLIELNLSVNVFQKKNNVTWRVKIPMKKYITTFWMGHFLTQSQSLSCLNNKANHRSVKWELPNGRGQGCNTWFWMIMYSFKNSFFFASVFNQLQKIGHQVS